MTWGPVKIPVLAGDSYIFWLDGAGIVKDKRSVKPPKPGAVIELDLLG
jgi:hypothetical protein